MSLKRVVNLTEGPVDYMRGLASGISAAPQRAKQTSQTANLVKAVKVLAQMLQRAKSAQRTQQSPQQYSTPGATQVSGQTNRMPTRPQMTFSSFIHHTTGEQLNEGVWDFVKGAGAHIRDKAIDKINQYAEGPSWLKDVVQAGKAAHTAAEQGRSEQSVDSQVKLIRQMIQQMGPNPRKTLQRAVQMAGVSGDVAVAIFSQVFPQAPRPVRAVPGVKAQWSQQQPQAQQPQARTPRRRSSPQR